MNYENQQTLSTQGNADEKEDQLGGTTNLSLDQLKKEGGISGTTRQNPDGMAEEDDLADHDQLSGDTDDSELPGDEFTDDDGLTDDDELSDDDDPDAAKPTDL